VKLNVRPTKKFTMNLPWIAFVHHPGNVDHTMHSTTTISFLSFLDMPQGPVKYTMNFTVNNNTMNSCHPHTS
jgi:hypothetical protein